MTEFLHWLTLYAPVIFAVQMWFGPGWCCPPVCSCRRDKVKCTEGVRACEYGLLIEGVTNGACTGCSDINGTYILTETSDVSDIVQYDGVWSVEWPNLNVRLFGGCYNWTSATADFFRIRIVFPPTAGGFGNTRTGNIFIGDIGGTVPTVDFQNRNRPADETPYPCLTDEDMSDLKIWGTSPHPCDLTGASFNSWAI